MHTRADFQSHPIQFLIADIGCRQTARFCSGGQIATRMLRQTENVHSRAATLKFAARSGALPNPLGVPICWRSVFAGASTCVVRRCPGLKRRLADKAPAADINPGRHARAPTCIAVRGVHSYSQACFCCLCNATGSQTFKDQQFKVSLKHFKHGTALCKIYSTTSSPRVGIRFFCMEI